MSENKVCSYERPGVYAELHLYCTIMMATYIPYENDEQAVAVAKRLQETGGKYGEIFTHSEAFFEHPSNNSALFSINLGKPLPSTQCSFNIYTKERAQDAVSFLPTKNEDNLIALHFYCSEQSRGEYFPVTYRQG